MDATPPSLTPDAFPNPSQPSNRFLAAVKTFARKVLKLLSDLNSYLAELLRQNRPGVISVLTARPYTMIVAVALLSVLSTVVVTRVVVGVNAGPDYSSMQHMIQDIKDSGRKNWNIYSNVSNIKGDSFKITSVEKDRVCFRSLPSETYGDQYLQKGCMFYQQIVFVLPVDNTEY